MEFKRNNIAIISSIVIIAAVAALYALGIFKKNSAPQAVPTATTTAFVNTETPIQPLLAGDSEKKVTVADASSTGSYGKNAPVYAYNLIAENGIFSPSELVFAKNSRVQINFKAVDADYDLQIGAPIGAYIVAKKGMTSAFGFEENQAGRYDFSCSKMCPSGADMKGVIIIK